MDGQFWNNCLQIKVHFDSGGTCAKRVIKTTSSSVYLTGTVECGETETGAVTVSHTDSRYSQQYMTDKCTHINAKWASGRDSRSLLYILGLQPRDKAAMLVVNTKEIFWQNLHQNRDHFPAERNAFVLDPQHGRRDVTCKPAILRETLI